MTKQIKVVLKTDLVSGRTLIVPFCAQAARMAKLCGRKTLAGPYVAKLKQLGYTVLVVGDDSSLHQQATL